MTHHEISPTRTYPCPGSVTIDGRVKTNYDSESFGAPIDLEDALGYSCDTFFYVPAANEYYADQNRIADGKKPHEYLQHTAASFGVGPLAATSTCRRTSRPPARTPTARRGWRGGRRTRTPYCAEARDGLPERREPTQRAYLTQLASENCTDGWRYRAGDNADMAIGQGETTMSPLQLAVAYSALVNGGRIWQPKLGWGVVNGKGKLVQDDQADGAQHGAGRAEHARLHRELAELRTGLGGVGRVRLPQSPYASRIGGKTGTAEVYGKQDTSWLATWGPIYHTARHTCARGSSSSAWSSRPARAPPRRDRCSSASGTASSAPTARSRSSRACARRHLPKIAPQTR